MAIFKGQGKSGVTGPTVQKTVGKNKQTAVNDALHRYAQAPKGSGGCKPPKAPPMVSKPNMAYKPTSMTFPDYKAGNDH